MPPMAINAWAFERAKLLGQTYNLRASEMYQTLDKGSFGQPTVTHGSPSRKSVASYA